MLSENELSLIAEFSRAGFFPIVNVYSEESILRLVALLRQFSINIIEITIRSPDAFKCIEAIRNTYDDVLVGAGSILDESSFEKARKAGANFFISPCFHRALCLYAQKKGLAYIPAFVTPSELFEAIRLGFKIIKVFPAAAFGSAYVESITKPFIQFDFNYIPTGGITSSNLKEFLSIPHVIACGMSGFVETEDMSLMDEKSLFDKIAQLCEIRKSVYAQKFPHISQ
ncbi:MAG: bifunctional 4-hydroxy-2-oxoglutarate aldolase/2-dehydro-3-deoxy-phosphogluconate aldolase [Spirochaetes bacterium]|nr:bifunctional 4-hydroxy-2-oxoglutarate aldolase/2-dehydro-3-deoxy-phosphogluconate aldolase [Spirochaetota bacterium]